MHAVGIGLALVVETDVVAVVAGHVLAALVARRILARTLGLRRARAAASARAVAHRLGARVDGVRLAHVARGVGVGFRLRDRRGWLTAWIRVRTTWFVTTRAKRRT